MAVLLQGGGHETDTGLPPSRPIASPVLVGREDELSRLVEVAGNRPALALVEGEAGLGKTRLVAELLKSPRIANLRHLVGRCHPLREPFPLGPIVEALRSAGDFLGASPLPPAVGALRFLLPELSDRLPPLPEPTGDPGSDRHVLFQGLLDVFGRLGPAVCVLEDLHWGDERTWDFLHFLGSQLPSELALIVTYRREGALAMSPVPELAARSRMVATTTHVRLSPLTLPEVHRLVNELLPGDDPSEEFATQIRERTSGIPFAVEEVVRLVHDRRELFHTDAWWVRRSLEQLEIPPTIRDAVVGRAAQLDADGRRVVDAAAVLDMPSTEAQLARVAGLSATRGVSALAQALRAVVLVEVGDRTYGFRHALACQSLYEAIPAPERTRLHRRAAHVLEACEPLPVAQLARHSRAADRPREWARYAEMAADHASARRDAESATHYLNEAVMVPGLSAEALARLVAKLTEVVYQCSIPLPDTGRVLQRLADDDRLPPKLRGWVRAVLGGSISQHGCSRSRRRGLERAVTDLKDTPYLQARVMLDLALGGGEDDHNGARLRWLARSASVASTLNAPLLELEIGVARAVLSAELGETHAPDLIEALPWGVVTCGGHPRAADVMMCAAHLLVVALIDVGEYDRARLIHQWSGECAQDLGWGRWKYVHVSHGILLDWVTGEWRDLEGRAGHLSDTLESTEEGSVGYLVTGLLALARGQVTPAETAFTVAARTVGSAASEARIRAGRWRLHLEHDRSIAGVTDNAEFIALLADRPRSGATVGELLPAAVEALTASGRSADATSLMRRVAREFGLSRAPLIQASVSWSRGVIAASEARYSVAAAAYARAEHQFARLPRPYDAARAAERRGLCLAALAEPAAADCLVSALEQFRRLEAAGDVKRVRRALRAHGFRVPPAERPRVTRGMALSPQEEEVVRCAATGRTGWEISAELSLSRRTVEQYLRFAMRKLGVDRKRDLIGRTDLAEVAGGR